MKTALIAYHHDSHASWDEQLTWLQFAFNTARHEAHNEVHSLLFFGFVPNTPLSNIYNISELLPDSFRALDLDDMWERAHKQLLHSHHRRERRYNRSRVLNHYNVGDLVMLDNNPLSRAVDKFAAKLAPRFLGPFSITEVYNGVNFRLCHVGLGYDKRTHVSQIKPFVK